MTLFLRLVCLLSLGALTLAILALLGLAARGYDWQGHLASELVVFALTWVGIATIEFSLARHIREERERLTDQI